MTAGRGVDRVEDGQHAGPDAEVDDRWVHIRPTEPERTGPFLVLTEERFTTPGFETHAHRGIETATVVLDGALGHADSTGGAGVLHVGDAQWMTAGRGIEHREVAAPGRHAHILQLWVDLPAGLRDAPPGHQELRAADRPRLARPGAVVDVVAGTVDGVVGPARPVSPVQLVLVTLDPGAALALPVPPADRTFALVVAGDAEVGDGRPVGLRQTAWSEPGVAAHLDVRAGGKGARLVVASGRPADAPFVAQASS
ncbi:pirin family protein [Pseudonocardia sp. MH-G8]|uniref:pirin family protein n=1 Tax=Pseudonocardia sp. MH-G8 TaxID=1854588 RepID=UPI000BA0FF4B|nr:pirin family protein [Pseudonocardia sp. MH-G8]OZM76150.1 pirin family protein [Pseudonocardia sp. MH-G8]